MDSIKKKVLMKITPTKRELIEEKKLVEDIKKQIKRINGKHSHIEWCGSSARGTHLRGDKDIDLFLMFDKKLPSEELEQEGLRIGKLAFGKNKWEIAYSQHPYIRGEIRGFKVEIVPSYIVPNANEKQSAVDRTPFHNKYLLERFTEKQKQEARLLKQFLKGIGAYGADLKNQALPGYGVELLILKYGTFDKAIKKISGWGEKTVILLEKRDRDPTEEFFTPLIIIDPVDENRNVASALSIEQYNKMRYAAKKYLENPSEEYFFGKEKEAWPKEKIIEELTKKEFIAIQGTFPKKILADLVWGQLRRYLRKTANCLEENDFIVKKSALWSDEKKIFFMYELNTLTLPKTKKLVGPIYTDIDNVRKFLAKKRRIISKPQIENNRIVLIVEREETKAKSILKKFIQKTKKEEKKGLKEVLKKAKVLTEKEILEHYRGNFAVHLTQYLQGKEIFE